MIEDLDRRIAIEVMEWHEFEFRDSIRGWYRHADCIPTTSQMSLACEKHERCYVGGFGPSKMADHCNHAIKKMQKDGFLYERINGAHIFKKLHEPRIIGGSTINITAGFDCLGVCVAMLKAKETEQNE